MSWSWDPVFVDLGNMNQAWLRALMNPDIIYILASPRTAVREGGGGCLLGRDEG